MEFYKAHGTANDFVVLPDLDDRLDLDAALVRALCDRRRGIGADGVLRLGASQVGDVFMDYRNADGSVVEMCGNGVRVVAKHVVDHGLITPRRSDGDGATQAVDATDELSPGGRVDVETRAGTKEVSVALGPDGLVAQATVDMGPPIWELARVPFEGEGPGEATQVLDVDGTPVTLTVLSMGNPHAVLLVDDVSAAPVATLGPRLETDPRFPEGVNVEFAEVAARGRLRLRVWERGVGETAACGTGACAAAVAFQRRGLVDSDVSVHLPGGVLRIRRGAGEDGGVLLTGPAVEVARGRLVPSWLRSARADLPRAEVVP